MKTITRIFAALCAVLAGLFFMERRRNQQIAVKSAVEKDNAEALPMAVLVGNLEQKVNRDEKISATAVDAYNDYRAAHPIDGGDGGDK